MPLPDNAQLDWPPKPWQPIYRDFAEADAWYSGDPDKLAAFYGVQTPTRPSERVAGVVNRLIEGIPSFWGRRSLDKPSGRQRVHIPAASDVAATGADLLFGDEPKLLIPEAHQETAEPDAKATQDRLAEIVEEDGLASTLLEGAEVCGAMGGAYLRPVWDKAVCDCPMLTVVHADYAVPEFQWGRLMAVTFWTCLVEEGNGTVWRHLERHERNPSGGPGVILHGLYAGTRTTLGLKRDLSAMPQTADLQDATPLPAGIEGIDVRYVPNVRPNRKHRGQPIGRADTAGSEGLMDALDEAMTSWMRDIRLAKARIIVPDEFLDRQGRGQGASFDVDNEVFAPLNMDPANMEKAGITVSQFAIRTQEHMTTCSELFERIVVAAGYSPQSFGMEGDGGAQTATEVSARESRSFRTTARKQGYWQRALEDVTEIMLIVDREVFGSGVTPMRPRVEFAELGQSDIREVSATVLQLFTAQSASIETRVRMVNPDLDEEGVAAEVARIIEETGAAPVPDPTGGLP